MFTHTVIFWTDPAKLNAADELIAGAKKYLSQVPGIINFHVGKMVPSTRAVVEQSYQVGLSIHFDGKDSQDAYQTHPLHDQFIAEAFKPNCARVVVYDFE